MIYQTERLLIRKLEPSDINPFHEMQSNQNVMEYTDNKAKDFDTNYNELHYLINCYSKPNNDFWVWAVIRKEDNTFLGTIALIKDDDGNDETGFRYLEKYWNNGYGFEALIGIINYARQLGIKTLVADVYAKNIGSEHILKKADFKFVKEYICKERNLIDRLYKLEL